MARPLLVFDGDCGFCRAWVERWRHATGDAVEYAPSQEAAGRLPSVPAEAFARAVQFLDADGSLCEGAEAVFRALSYAPWPGPVPLQAYRGVPGVRPVTEAAYGLVARHRAAFSRLTRLLWGGAPERPTFRIARSLFLAGLALCYGAAFVSFAVQADGLVGSRGITPAAELFEAAGRSLGGGKYMALPSLFWLTGTSDSALRSLPWAGAGAAALLAAGVVPAASAALCWLLYLSLYSAGGVFMGFQWDVLLLEAGFIAVLLAPWGLRPRLADAPEPPGAALWLTRWLWFRLMLLAGLVKLSSGDGAWRDLTALSYHFETQPLPHAAAWYAHHLPPALLRAGCAGMFVAELLLPFGAFLPRVPRLAAFLGVNALMLAVMATGNYNFFNLLAMALSLPLLDDRLLGALLPRLGRAAGGARPAEAPWRRRAAAAFLCFSAAAGTASGLLRVAPESASLAPVAAVAGLGRPLALVNAYGLFAVMTRPRFEIVLEGSRDGREWRSYDFLWKPGDPRRPPGWAQPHQPRLDWQMWFAALSPFQSNPWYLSFLKRLLEGSPPVKGLLAADPFPEGPPRYLRSLLFVYRFSDAAGRARGEWWTREFKGLYAPVVTLTPDGRLAAVEATGSR